MPNETAEQILKREQEHLKEFKFEYPGFYQQLCAWLKTKMVTEEEVCEMYPRPGEPGAGSYCRRKLNGPGSGLYVKALGVEQFPILEGWWGPRPPRPPA